MKLLILAILVLAGCGQPDPEPQPGPGPGPGPSPTAFTLRFKHLCVDGTILQGAKVTVDEAKMVITTEVTKLEQ